VFEDPPPEVFLNKIDNHHILQLPSNHIPKGLVPSEILFDENNVLVKFKGLTKDVDVAKCNIGTEGNPKFVKLSSSLSREQRAEYTELLKEVINVFAYTYEYLRTYDTSVIDHTIPLKEEAKPFRKKLR
jgi:hypothetical protein